ncbi:MAG: hypothetical protein ABW090_17675 [Sedimenticola sp.]
MFPKKLFKTVVSYAYAVLEFKTNIQRLLEEGKITKDELGTRGSILNTEDFCDPPVVNHLGRKYRLKELPASFLFCDGLEYTDGRKVATINLGPDIHNIISLETGLRGRHILWLDISSFDSHVVDQKLTGLIYPMYVNTDKRGAPWTPIVSSRVIELLRGHRAWVSSVTDPSFHLAVNYIQEEVNYGKITPLFAHNWGNGGPFDPEHYRHSWNALCLGLSWFFDEYGLDHFRFVAYAPSGAKKIKHKYLKSEVTVIGPDDDTKVDGTCCPTSLRSVVTPHGARATVVSNHITCLPAHVIGKYITGQTERVVYYYAKLSIEDIKDLVIAQRQGLHAVPSNLRNSGHDVLDEEMLHANKVNKILAESIGNPGKLDTAISNFGLMSLDSLTDNTAKFRNGIEILKNSKYSVLGYNKTHICPFGNECPAEIVKQYGETGLCGICAYSVKSIDHLPSINAAKHRAMEWLEGLTETYERLCDSRDSTDDEIYLIEQKRDNQALNILGWELTEEILYAKQAELKQGAEVSEYISFESEYVANYLERIHVDNDETSYLITRLRECIEYPSLESPEIRARFEFAKKRLLAASGDLSALFDPQPSHNPAMELFALINVIKKTNRLTTSEILTVTRIDVSDLLPACSPSTKLLGEPA